MEDKLRAFMDRLFYDVTPNRKSVELKEEILQNLTDKYHDLVAEGKSTDAAYNIAVASVGDMDELLVELKEKEREYTMVETENIQKAKKKTALLTSIAIGMYILSILPPILFSEAGLSEDLGAALMFTFIAIATMLIVYAHMSKPKYLRAEDTIVEEFKEWQDYNESSRRAYKAILSAMWSIITVIYFVVSFTTMSWHISWVIFLIGGAIQGILQAIYELKRRG